MSQATEFAIDQHVLGGSDIELVDRVSEEMVVMDNPKRLHQAVFWLLNDGVATGRS